MSHHPAYHHHALAALAASDLMLAKASTLAIDAPHTLGQVTRDWLSAELGKQVPGAQLAELVVEDEHDGMTSRKHWRLNWNEAGRAAGLPGSVFVKATPEAPYNRETLAMLHMHEIETNFYAQIQPELPELAPKAWYAKSYPGGRFMIVLEDLADRNGHPYWLADDCSLTHARAIAVALATLHATYWESPRLVGDLAWVRPRTSRFGWPWLRHSFGQARARVLEPDAGYDIPEEAVRLMKLWDKHAEAVYAHWETQPHTVLHGDSHLGNTFSYPDGRGGLFDWQVMFRGSGLRDLNYFIHSALNNDDRARYQAEIFDLYLETLAAGGVKLDRDLAWNDYCLYTFDAWDANIKTWARGFYGHDPKALKRCRDANIGSLLDNDVAGRLHQLLKTLG
jgi:hypothetical protein